MNFLFNKSAELFTNVQPETKLEKFIQFPLIRLLIVIIFLLPVYASGIVVKSFLSSLLSPSSEIYVFYFVDLMLIALAVFLYNGYTRVVENRGAYEFSFDKSFIEISSGFFLAFILVGSIVSVLSLPGYYSIEEFNPIGNMVYMFFVQFKIGFVEELLFRVILFKLVEEYFGSWTAIVVQAGLFGFAHAGNPNATFLTSMSITVFFGIFFAAGYMLTRRIWFILGFHWGWNFFQAGLFGLQNSGWEQPSLITPSVEGPAILTGGEWGLENSIISMILLFTIGLILLKFAVDRKQLVKPAWKR